MTIKTRWFLSTLLVVASAAQAQVVPVVQLPPLTITGTVLDATVTYDSARGVYRYQYTIVAPSTNKADLGGLSIDVSGKTAHVQIDPDLQNNVRRFELSGMGIQPDTTVPVGIIMPDPNGWTAMIGNQGQFGFFPRSDQWGIQPGMTQGGFVLESKFPPGMRNVRVTPSESAWFAIERQYESYPATFQPESAAEFELHFKAPAPLEVTEADLFSGGGQQPAEVNKFLRYAAPTDNRVKLSAGTATTTVIVYYGNAILPATFHATLNGADITSQFQPVPGVAQVIKIPLTPGSNKLQLSVDGKKSSGQSATDTDTFTFIVG
jgi:hypothetical protein